MRTLILFLTSCLLITVARSSCLMATEQQTEESELQQVKDQVAGLTRLIEQIQKERENEIAGLKAEIERLRQDQGHKGALETEEEEKAGTETDELAALRGLALDEAGGGRERVCVGEYP